MWIGYPDVKVGQFKLTTPEPIIAEAPARASPMIGYKVDSIQTSFADPRQPTIYCVMDPIVPDGREATFRARQ